MLADAPLTTILPVLDLARARTFYEQRLGLRGGRAKPDGKYEYPVGNGALALFQRGGPTKADHTAVSFAVRDISRAIRELESRGVKFHDYDLPGLKTVDHVCVLGSEKAAWFSDPEGNILCLHEDLT
ncbi:MAG: VOC family protein [Myxococcaceae bacterium]|nr:MAG: VOC family protein [Myxococcaceae bacterium]